MTFAAASDTGTALEVKEPSARTWVTSVTENTAPATGVLLASPATIGSYLTDTLTVAGTYGQPVRVTGHLQTADPERVGRVLECPLADSGAWSKAATVAIIPPFTVTGNGPHPVPGRYLTTQASCYTFTYQITVALDAASPDPSARSILVNLPAGDPGESALVSAPTITTSSSATTTSPATTITDQVRIQGLHLPAGDTAILRAYYLGAEPVLPIAGGDSDAPACPNTAVLDQMPAEGRPATAGCNPTGWEHTPIAASPPPITVTGDGSYTTDPITLPAQAGYGTWVETLTYNGITVALTPAGTPSETVHAVAPVITTTITSTDPSGGHATVSDILTVTGLRLQPDDTASISAHVLSTASDGTSCAGIDWSVADRVGEPSSLDLPGDGRYATPPVPVGLGCHTYYEQLVINGRPVVTGAEQPGQPSETLLITAPAGPLPSGTPTPAPATSHNLPSTPPPTSSGHRPRPTTPTPATSSRPPTVEGDGHSLANTGFDTVHAEIAGSAAILVGCLVLLLIRRHGGSTHGTGRHSRS